MAPDIYLRQGLIPKSDVELYPSEAVSSGAITGMLAAADTQDSVTFAGIVASAGVLLGVETQDSAAIQGAVVTSGTLVATEAPDVAAFAGAAASNVYVLFQGSSATPPERLVTTGQLAATEAPDEAHFEGTVGIDWVAYDNEFLLMVA